MIIIRTNESGNQYTTIKILQQARGKTDGSSTHNIINRKAGQKEIVWET